jgi:hypothetical protein
MMRRMERAGQRLSRAPETLLECGLAMAERYRQTNQLPTRVRRRAATCYQMSAR